MMETAHYPAEIFWGDDDSGYIAIAPDLPGCSAFGRTQQEALEELQTAIEGWISAARAVGNDVPPPSRPSAASPSGRVLLRMPRSLHAQLAKQADNEGVSLNQYIVSLLSRRAAERTIMETLEDWLLGRRQWRRWRSIGSDLVAHFEKRGYEGSDQAFYVLISAPEYTASTADLFHKTRTPPRMISSS
jgi:predicted RNase H-like HicB family nuclease